MAYCTDCEDEVNLTTGFRCMSCGGGRVLVQSFSERVTAARDAHDTPDPNPAVEYSKRLGVLFDPPDKEG